MDRYTYIVQGTAYNGNETRRAKSAPQSALSRTQTHTRRQTDRHKAKVEGKKTHLHENECIAQRWIERRWKALSIVAAHKWQMNTRRQLPVHKNGRKDVNICIKMWRKKKERKKKKREEQTKNFTTTTSTIKIMVDFVFDCAKSVRCSWMYYNLPSPPQISSSSDSRIVCPFPWVFSFFPFSVFFFFFFIFSVAFPFNGPVV